jgi:ribonuclease VapC
MVIDTSAIMAILQLEPEAELFATLIEVSPVRLISSVSVLEAGIIAEARKGEAGAQELDALLAQSRATVSAFDLQQAEVAREAFRRFGKGRHPAALNFGDCAAYALSRVSGEPLLFKGTDFGQTDVVAVR